MIRSSKVSLKFTNQTKLHDLARVLEEGRSVIQYFVDVLWDAPRVPTLLPKEITGKVDTWLSARMLQSLGKQASGIVRSCKSKQYKRDARVAYLKKLGKVDQAEKLIQKHLKNPVSKPQVTSSIPLELDSRFVTLDMNNETSFDAWITFGSLGDRLKISTPIKRTKHLNRLLDKGELKQGVRLSNNSITFMVEIPDPPKKEVGSVLGIDIGKTNLYTTSQGDTDGSDNHGHTLDSILQKMTNKRKGSKGFQRAQAHRENYINWSINRLNLNGVKQVNIENIKHLNYGRNTSSVLKRWVYRDILDKIEATCEQYGVHVVSVNPTYTSQRCSCCGWVKKTNRNGKSFHCTRCGLTIDADLNGAINISLNLPPIPEEVRRSRLNLKGFYWLSGQESIVPDTQKVDCHVCH